MKRFRLVINVWLENKEDLKKVREMLEKGYRVQEDVLVDEKTDKIIEEW